MKDFKISAKIFWPISVQQKNSTQITKVCIILKTIKKVNVHNHYLLIIYIYSIIVLFVYVENVITLVQHTLPQPHVQPAVSQIVSSLYLHLKYTTCVIVISIV